MFPPNGHWFWVRACLCLAALSGCTAARQDKPDTGVTVRIAPTAPQAIQIAAKDLVKYFTAMGQPARLSKSTAALTCLDGATHLLMTGDGVPVETLGNAANDQTFRIHETRCGTGRLVALSGGGLLGRQFAAYDFLRLVGVRFFHPEQEFVPPAPTWPAIAIDRTVTPAFRDRSVSLHLTHPLELGDAFTLRKPEFEQEGVRYIDWTIKNLGNSGPGGIGTGAYADYGFRRGFARGAGITLTETQQGSDQVLNPDDPRPWQEQLTDAIEQRMVGDAATRPRSFGILFGTTEFTPADPDATMAQLNFIADYMAQHYPDVELTTINHGVHGDPLPNYGVRYYDLPKFAPPNLGVRVHTLMFYDTERPAPVYGNDDFHFLYDFMQSESKKRNLWYFPESAWWLTFDNPVPLYLPLTIEARDRDIQRLKPMLAGKLVGHHTFGSGHEWGYWQNEYCSLRLPLETDMRWQDCFKEITGIFGPAAKEAESVIEDSVALEATFMFDAKMLRWLVGSDDQTEAASFVGVMFHPLPPTAGEIGGWSQQQCDTFLAEDTTRLTAIGDAFAKLTDRMNEVRNQVPATARPFFDEIRDGLEIFGYRALHQQRAYQSMVQLRASQLQASAPLLLKAKQSLEDAKKYTALAAQVVERREQGYRYHPISRSIGGGPKGDEDVNWTTYTFRVHNRTHHLFYWTRVDQQAADAFAGANQEVGVQDALLGPNQALSVRVFDPGLGDISVDFGDGAKDAGQPPFVHSYAAVGPYTVTVSGTLAGAQYKQDLPVARLSTRTFTGFSPTVVAPKGASLIAGLLPGLVFGSMQGDTGALGFTANPDGTVAPTLWAQAEIDSSNPHFHTKPIDTNVPIVNSKAHTVYSTILVHGFALDFDADQHLVTLGGDLDIHGIVAAVVVVGKGGFDAKGARDIVASTLGYTVSTLPETVPFLVQYKLAN